MGVQLKNPIKVSKCAEPSFQRVRVREPLFHYVTQNMGSRAVAACILVREGAGSVHYSVKGIIWF